MASHCKFIITKLNGTQHPKKLLSLGTPNINFLPRQTRVSNLLQEFLQRTVLPLPQVRSFVLNSQRKVISTHSIPPLNSMSHFQVMEPQVHLSSDFKTIFNLFLTVYVCCMVLLQLKILSITMSL